MNEAQYSRLVELKKLDIGHSGGETVRNRDQWARLQREIIAHEEQLLREDEVISNQQGSAFEVIHFNSALYVKKVLRITDPITGEHVDWNRVGESYRIGSEYLGGIMARALQFSNSTFYQIRRIPVREFLMQNLGNLKNEGNLELFKNEDKNKQPLQAQAIHQVLAQFPILQEEMWSRGVIDQDPKLLDNYGVFYHRDQWHLRLIDFSHISTNRNDFYFNSRMGGSILDYNKSNIAALKRVGEEFGLGNCIENIFTVNIEDIFSQNWPANRNPSGILRRRRTGPVLDTRLYRVYQEINI